MASMSTTTSASSSRDGAASAASNKRKRSPQGCVVAENDVIVEELQKIKGKIRESSHLAGNYARAIISIQHHTERIASAREAKQLRNIGNYIANQIQSILQKHQIRSAGDAAPPSTTVAPPTRPPPAVPSAATERRHPATSASAAAAPITSTTSAAATTVMRRPYLPAEGKQPWYVLRVLKEEDATSEQSAVALSALLTKMQAIGYDGALPKIRVCITSLLNTHQIITKASGGGIYLNERGILSAELCIHPTAVPRASTAQDSGRSEIASVVAAEAQESDSMESLAVRLSKRSAAVHRAATTTLTTSRHHDRTRLETDMVCIDLSDSDADNYDSDTATIRATSMSPRSRRDLEQEEPDAEPSYSTSQRRVDTIANSADPFTALIREGDEWEIVLILDHREVLSRRNRDILERKLLDINVTCEVRSLNVGDVQWVARRYRGLESVEEFMLNVIVERKEVRDLSGSIIDRRYNEQKTRLRDSGMTHVIYLVEGSLTQQTTVRSSGLQTALCRTQVQNQFFVQQCQNADESVAFLRGVHMNLLSKLPATMKCRNRERGSTPPSRLTSSAAPTMNDWTRQFCRPIRSYTDFNAQFRKKADFTVGEIYQMMLMQVHSLSSSRTVALSAQYPTFQYLAQAVARGEKLQDVRYGESQRRLGAKSHEFVKFLLESTDYERDTPTVGVSGALDN